MCGGDKRLACIAVQRSISYQAIQLLIFRIFSFPICRCLKQRPLISRWCAKRTKTFDQIQRTHNGELMTVVAECRMLMAFLQNQFYVDRAIFKFDGSRIVYSGRGNGFDKFKKEFRDNERAFGYIV